MAGVGKKSDGSASVLGGTVVPGGTNVTECGSGPAMSHVTVVPVATLNFSGRNSSTAMFGSLGSLSPASSDTSARRRHGVPRRRGRHHDQIGPATTAATSVRNVS